MIRVLEPLAQIPGVRMALLVAPDGVPVVVRGKAAEIDADAEGPDSILSGETADSLAALATGWLGELSRLVAPLSWDAPQRVVLRAARGTLVMVNAPASVLLVILDRGMAPEELRLPMEATVARMQRILRSMGSAERRPNDPRASTPDPALPVRQDGKGPGQVRADTHSKEFPPVLPG
jgi:predicted regulator of Ras-like GTPase activity (Roadblock/LC7/MglB family)